jgi:hypothetical protein
MRDVKKLISISVEHFCMIGKNEEIKKKEDWQQTAVCYSVCFAAGVNNVVLAEMALNVWKCMLAECTHNFEFCTKLTV